MEDVKDQAAPATSEEPAEQTAEEATPQPTEQTAEKPVEAPKEQTATQEAQERMVPISVVQKERKLRQDYQRRLSEAEQAQKLSAYDPNDLNTVLSHPVVQELMIKEAKRELQDFARDALEQYPNLHPQVKKAILSNARGFVNESTTDIESAKVDLAEYIDSIAEDAQANPATQQPAKTFKVASTNQSTVDSQGVRPAEIQAILSKPLDEWTDEETETVEAYAKTNPKK